MSSNASKIQEVKSIIEAVGVKIIPINQKIEELQTEDVDRLVKDKVTKAFCSIGRPLFVEHTGLYLDGLNDLPAGLTQIFWDKLEADNFAALVRGLGNSSVIARTVIGYCDGKQILFFKGEVAGRVSDTPKGPREFQWDCLFIPAGHTQTFAEMGALKNEVSMRRIALDAFAKYLNPAGGGCR